MCVKYERFRYYLNVNVRHAGKRLIKEKKLETDSGKY